MQRWFCRAQFGQGKAQFGGNVCPAGPRIFEYTHAVHILSMYIRVCLSLSITPVQALRRRFTCGTTHICRRPFARVCCKLLATMAGGRLIGRYSVWVNSYRGVARTQTIWLLAYVPCCCLLAACLLAWWLACLLACRKQASQPAILPPCLFACPLAVLIACLPACTRVLCLLACLPAYLPVRSPARPLSP